MPSSRPSPVAPAVPTDEALLRSLLAACPDRLARRRQLGSARGVMAGGRGVRVATVLLLETNFGSE